ncbi:hypothetical protein OC835_001008 [Tilletia horrida]|nr:hypothetical protein OC835_001008 [Tilletia horrida]KAK0563734.1 hypothetical protein OC844_002072 [Tilletia horrida]
MPDTTGKLSIFLANYAHCWGMGYGSEEVRANDVCDARTRFRMYSKVAPHEDVWVLSNSYCGHWEHQGF